MTAWDSIRPQWQIAVLTVLAYIFWSRTPSNNPVPTMTEIIISNLTEKLHVVEEVCSETTNACYLIADLGLMENGRLRVIRQMIMKNLMQFRFTAVELIVPEELSYENCDTSKWAIDRIILHSTIYELMVSIGFMMKSLKFSADFNSDKFQNVLMMGLGGGQINNFFGSHQRANMVRRKQAKPTKRPQEDYDYETPEPAKLTKGDAPSPAGSAASPQPRLQPEMTPSCSKDPPPSDPVRKSAVNPLLMLERSLKRFEPQKTGAQPLRTQTNPFSNGLGALFQFVGKMQGDSLWNAQQRKENDVDSILKCLQCGRTFQTMEMLIRHMQDTQHFNNLPKTYSSLVQMDRQKVLNLKLQMKADSMKLACVKCGEIPTNIDKHLKEVHDVKTSSDWLKNIRIIRDGDDPVTSLSASPQAAANSPHLNKLMSLINTVDKK